MKTEQLLTNKRLLSAAILCLFALFSAAQKPLPLRLWYDSPATFFEEALPIGNGKMGAMVFGGTDDNVILLNDITLWTGRPVDHNLDKDAHRWIPKIREALFKEDYRLADSLQLHVQGPNSAYYQPLATLHIIDNSGGGASCYRRELDLDSALCRDFYVRNGVTFTREYFASHPDKLIAVRLRADKRSAINCRLTLTALIPHSVKASDGQLIMTGNAVGDPKNSIHFCSVLRVKTADGTVTAADSSLYLHGVSDAELYFVNETSFNGFDKHPVTQGAPYSEQAANDIAHAMSGTYSLFRKRHITDYQRLFGRFVLTLGASEYDAMPTTEQQLRDYTDHPERSNPYLETLYMQFGRYLLIASSRTAGVPANLQGLWNPYVKAPWRSNYTVNINLEENYWLAEVSNLSEMTMPLNAFVQALAENGKYTARNYYGIDSGWCSSHNSDLWAMTNPVGEKQESPEWSNWNMGGAWLSQALWEHFAFTQDRNYLRTTAYPLLKGASTFMLRWLVENPFKPGELFTAPSTSPENEYITDKGYHGTTCYGATADLAIIRELFRNTLSAAELLQTDTALQTKLRAVVPRLHPYSIGKQGDLNEWYYDWDDFDPQHRHQSHLIGLFPGHQITVDGTPELAQACARSLEIKGDKTTGWSTGWRINLWARLRNAQRAYAIYRTLLTYVSPDCYQGSDRRRSGGTYPNLFDAHPPFQIDGNFGGTAGVCEMLVQSDGQRIDLLPALPDAWKDGQVQGICARGGYEIAMTWKGSRVVSAVVKSKAGGQVTVSYNGKSVTLTLGKGQKAMLK